MCLMYRVRRPMKASSDSFKIFTGVVVLLLSCFLACTTIATAGPTTFAAAPPRSGFGVIYIGRPFGWNTSLIPLSIELDGRPLVQLGVNSYTRVELRPARYSLAAADTYMTKITFGTPRPVILQVEAGKAYFVLPKQWMENVRPAIEIVGGKFAVPSTSGDKYGSFSVQQNKAGATPSEFSQLSYVASTGQ